MTTYYIYTNEDDPEIYFVESVNNLPTHEVLDSPAECADTLSYDMEF